MFPAAVQILVDHRIQVRPDASDAMVPYVGMRSGKQRSCLAAEVRARWIWAGLLFGKLQWLQRWESQGRSRCGDAHQEFRWNAVLDT